MNATSRAPVIGLLMRQFAWRHWVQAPRQSALLVLILALGIAVFFSIRLANRAALASFQNFTELLTEESDWLVEGPTGLLPDSILEELRVQLGTEAVTITPVLEATAIRARSTRDQTIGSQETLQLMGVDLIGVQNRAEDLDRRSHLRGSGRIKSGESPESESVSFQSIFQDPLAVFITGTLAERDRLRVGESLPVVIHERVVSLNIRGILPAPASKPKPPAHVLVMDLPALQSLVQRPGRLSRVELSVADGPNAQDRRSTLHHQLQEWGKDRWLVSSPDERKESAATMTRAFRLNLTILSLIALLVGVYLIFQSLDGSVVRRREEIGILRSLGVEEGQIQRAWLLEATALGLVGGGIGAMLGWAGAQATVRFVGRTVNALYYSTSVDRASLGWVEFLWALALATGTSLLAGWFPARDAARTPPAQILVRHARAPQGLILWRRDWIGCLLIILALGLQTLPPLRMEQGSRFPLAGYLAALCWILGGGILGGWILASGSRILRPLATHSLSLRLSSGHLYPPSGRHRLATAGLICAIAMTSGMGILVSSFDLTMRGWIERTFQADLYISSSAAQSATTLSRITPETWQAMVSHPGVAEANIVQSCEIRLPQGSTLLSGAELAVLRRRTKLSWVEKPLAEDVFQFERNEGLALVSESFSDRFAKRRGDRFPMPTPNGSREMVVAGVFADYGNERGSILIERRHFARWFQESQASAIMVFVKPEASIESMRSAWMERFPGLRIHTNEHLRSEILRIFQQTFSITYALEIIGILVAVIGLGLTLGSLLIERRGELTTLRALGLTRHEIALAAASEGLLLTVAGVMVGMAVSIALGWMLIHVINKQTFGWTLSFHLPWLQMASLASLVVAVGTAVAYGVGRWGADLPADREE